MMVDFFNNYFWFSNFIFWFACIFSFWFYVSWFFCLWCFSFLRVIGAGWANALRALEASRASRIFSLCSSVKTRFGFSTLTSATGSVGSTTFTFFAYLRFGFFSKEVSSTTGSEGIVPVQIRCH
jgi:hypothetical protein